MFKSSLFRYPLKTPSPSTHISPIVPNGSNFKFLSTTITCKVGIGTPILEDDDSKSDSDNSLNVTCTVVSVIPYIFINFVSGYFKYQPFIKFGFKASPPNTI